MAKKKVARRRVVEEIWTFEEVVSVLVGLKGWLVLNDAAPASMALWAMSPTAKTAWGALSGYIEQRSKLLPGQSILLVGPGGVVIREARGAA